MGVDPDHQRAQNDDNSNNRSEQLEIDHEKISFSPISSFNSKLGGEGKGVSPIRSFDTEKSSIKDETNYSFDDNERTESAQTSITNEAIYSPKIEESKDFADVMSMVEKIQYLTEAFALIAQHDSMDVSSNKATSTKEDTVYEDRSASRGSTGYSSYSLQAMLRETQGLREAASHMARKLKKQKGGKLRRFRSTDAKPSKRDLATAELERLVESLEQISTEVETTIQKMVDGSTGGDGESTISTNQEWQESSCAIVMFPAEIDQQQREVAPSFDRDDLKAPEMSKAASKEVIDVTNIIVMEVPAAKNSGANPSEPSSQHGSRHSRARSLSRLSHGSRQVRSSSHHSNTSQTSSKQSKDTNKSEAVSTPSNVKHQSRSSTPQSEIQNEEMSVVVIEDLDGDDDDRTAGSLREVLSGIRMLRSESNISLKSHNNSIPLSLIKSRSADGKIAGRDEHSIYSKSRKEPERQREEEDSPPVSRENYHNIVSAILNERRIRPSNDKKERPNHSTNDAKQSNQTTYDIKQSSQQKINLKNDMAIGNPELLSSLGSLNGDAAKSRSFDSQDRYAVAESERRISRIPAIVEKSQKKRENTPATIQPYPTMETRDVNEAIGAQTTSLPQKSIEIPKVSNSSKKSTTSNSSNINGGVVPVQSEQSISVKPDSTVTLSSTSVSTERSLWKQLFKRNVQVLSSGSSMNAQSIRSGGSKANVQQNKQSIKGKETEGISKFDRKNRVRQKIWNMIQGAKCPKPKEIKTNKTSEQLEEATNDTQNRPIVEDGNKMYETEARDDIGNEELKGVSGSSVLSQLERYSPQTTQSQSTVPTRSPLSVLLSNSSSELRERATNGGGIRETHHNSVPVVERRVLPSISRDEGDGLMITITHDSADEGIETAYEDSSVASYGVKVERNESYLSPSDKKFRYASDESSFPSGIYQYMDPKRIGTRPSYESAPTNSLSLRAQRPVGMRSSSSNVPGFRGGSSMSAFQKQQPIIQSKRIGQPYRYGVGKFAFMEPPEVPSKSMFDAE